MSLEWYDGFDSYNSVTQLDRVWDSSSNTNIFRSGRFGGNGIDLFNNTMTKTLTSVQTRVVGFAFIITGSISAAILAGFTDAGTNQVECRVTAAGALQVTRNGTVLGTSSSGLITTNTYAYVEFKAKIDSSIGTYEVRLFGTNVLSGSGANTKNTSNSTCDAVKFSYNSGNNNFIFDDVYILNTSGSVNNDFLGECRVLQNFPTGDGSTTQWTLSTGATHWGTIDESTPNDDTDYNSDATVGHIDLVTFGSISPTGAIAGVMTRLTARKDDVGTRQISEQCKSGSTTFTGANTFTMGSSYASFFEIREVDPNTSSAWTNSGVNNAQLGVKVIT